MSAMKPTPILDMEPDRATQLALLQQEVTIALNTRWQFQMRHRVNKKLGNDVTQFEKDLEQIEKYLSALESEIKAVAGE